MGDDIGLAGGEGREPDTLERDAVSIWVAFGALVLTPALLVGVTWICRALRAWMVAL